MGQFQLGGVEEEVAPRVVAGGGDGGEGREHGAHARLAEGLVLRVVLTRSE